MDQVYNFDQKAMLLMAHDTTVPTLKRLMLTLTGKSLCGDYYTPGGGGILPPDLTRTLNDLRPSISSLFACQSHNGSA